MKKILSILLACVLLASLAVTAAVPVSAASPKAQMLDCARQYLPEPLLVKYLPAIENTLRMIDVTQEQADQVNACIIEAYEYFEANGGYKGVTLHYYSKAHQRFAVDIVARICKILDLIPRYTFSTDADHDYDVVVTIYTAHGKRLAILDGDAVKQTNTPFSAETYACAAIAAVLMLGAVVAVVLRKKVVSER